MQATPVAVVAVLVIGAVLVVGTLSFALYLFIPVVSLGLVAVVAFLAIWRAFSIVDAARPGFATARIRIGAWAGLLVLVVFVSHLWVGWTLLSFYSAGQLISRPIAADPNPLPGEIPGCLRHADRRRFRASTRHDRADPRRDTPTGYPAEGQMIASRSCSLAWITPTRANSA